MMAVRVAGRVRRDTEAGRGRGWARSVVRGLVGGYPPLVGERRESLNDEGGETR